MVGEIEAVLDSLNQARVRYLVVGGVAVVLHGYLRTTADLDLRDRWIREKGLAVFSLWSPAHPTLEIDLFVSEPFDFDAVYSRAIRVPLEKIEATVIALEDLIALKRQVGRPRDLEDVIALESLRETEGRDKAGSNG